MGRSRAVLIPLLLLMAASAGAAPEAGGSFIGLFAEAEAELCTAPLVDAFELVTVYVVASLNPGYLGGLEAARFKLTNLPSLATGLWTAAWNGAPTVSGELDTGVLLEWSVAQSGQLVLLGSVEFQSFVAGWVGSDYELAVATADGHAELMVRAPGGAEFQVLGGLFTFNCSGECLCSPSTAQAGSDWGSIKALY